MLGLAWTIFGGRQFLLGATPLGQIVAVAGALVLTAVTTDVHARIRDRAVCNGRIEANNVAWQERELQAKAAYDQARAKRDQDIDAALEKRVTEKAGSIQQLAERLALQVKVHEATAPTCRVSPGLIDRRDRLLGRAKK